MRAARASEALLIPLARAQDAVARLEARSLPPGRRRRRVARPAGAVRGAGFLAHGSAVHPHDLALREANLTGSYTLAALTGQLREAAPWTTADGGGGAVADDHLVADALAYARQWRRLAELATWLPLRSLESSDGPLSQLGAPLADDAPTRAWLAALPGPAVTAGLLAAARVMAAGLPGMTRGDRLELGASYVAAALWRRHGYGRGCALPFWAAPVSRIDALARQGGGEFELGYLDCVAEAARRGGRELARLHAAARKIARCRRAPDRGCKRPARVALREPLVTGTSARPPARCLRPRRAGSRRPGWSRPACCAR